MPQSTIVKNHKIKAFYVDTIQVGKAKANKVTVKHYIHTQASNGFWCAIRDFSLKEKLGNEAVASEDAVQITIGNIQTIIEKWPDLILEDLAGNHYRIKAKPDEFYYDKGDIKLLAYRYVDTNEYGGTIYDQ